MIIWNGMDNIPQQGGVYLVTDGTAIVVATLSTDGNETESQWVLPVGTKVDQSSISHWAKLNLPDKH